MQESQDLILRHNFIQQLPKSIADRFIDNEDIKDKNKNGRQGPKYNPHQEKQGGKDIVTDPDKSHLRWRVQDGENYTTIFYKNQKKCPKTHDGKPICMKFFLRGFCDKSCTRAHKLTKDDEAEFDRFISRCREGGAAKPDF
jgi:hypothetical protein